MKARGSHEQIHCTKKDMPRMDSTQKRKTIYERPDKREI